MTKKRKIKLLQILIKRLKEAKGLDWDVNPIFMCSTLEEATLTDTELTEVISELWKDRDRKVCNPVKASGVSVWYYQSQVGKDRMYQVRLENAQRTLKRIQTTKIEKHDKN